MNSTGLHTIEEAKSLLKKQFEKRYRTIRGNSQSTIRQPSKQNQRNLSMSLNKGAKDSKERYKELQNSVQLNPQHKLSQTLQHINFRHHDKQSCLCDNCECGRHLCKFDVVKPQLTKRTHYQQTFIEKTPAQKTPVLIAKDTAPMKGSHLDMQTNYFKEFRDRMKDRIEKQKQNDHLNLFQGPAATLTTYGSLYPGHKGQNQYIKPTNKHRMGNFPLANKTTYKVEFLHRRMKESWLDKIPDHLKEGTTWMGQSTYCNTFKQPQPENYTHRSDLRVEKYYQQPDNAIKYESHYMKQYIPKPSTLCPSKIQIATRSHSHQKDLYKENSDFRTMSPQFHAFATSKITHY